MALTQNNRIAMVYCAGGSRAKRRGEADLSYLDCSMAKQAFADGVLECAQGCLGLGSCVEACRLDAIRIGPYGAAVVDRAACVGCGLCVEACPQGLIRLVDADTTLVLILDAGLEIIRTISPVFSGSENTGLLKNIPPPIGFGSEETSAGWTPHTEM